VSGFILIKPHSNEANRNATKFKPCCPRRGQTSSTQLGNQPHWSVSPRRTHTKYLIQTETQHAGWITSSGTSNSTIDRAIEQHKMLGAGHRRWRRVGVSEKRLRHEDQLVHHPTAFRFLKRPPQLQRKNNFENAVSRLPRELPLNSKLITGSPDSPALGRKEGPHCPLGLGV
jgi:hypothetical protein